MNSSTSSRAAPPSIRTPEHRTVQRRARLGFTSQILFGFALGVATGLFFGEPAAVLQPVVDAYIRLMQMTVIPYLVLGLMTSLGSLSRSDARLLAVGGGLSIALVWVATGTLITAMTFAFPEFQTGSFFSSALVEPPKPLNFAELFIPDNPFHSLANSVVPAIVLFCVALGLALIDIRGKEGVIAGLSVLNEAVSRVTRFITRLMPLGIFAIGAVAAGTMSIVEFQRLQVYFVTFIVSALLLSAVIVPAMVTAVTPFRYRDVASIAKDALLTAFVADNLFIVLPILAERSKGLLAAYRLHNETSDASVDAIIPIAYNIPMAGKLLVLLFLPFSAWLAGEPFGPTAYSALFAAGSLSFFAKTQTAIPFLMDLLDIPHDLFQLYLASDLLTGRFSSLAAAVCLLATALLATGAMTGYLVFQKRRIIRFLLIASGAVFGTVIVTKIALTHLVDSNYHPDQLIRNMRLAHPPVGTVLHEEPLPSAETLERGGPRSALARIRERGTLRVGYNADRIPLTYFNARHELVGFDVELAGLLARDLGVRLEFVPFAWHDLTQQLAAGAIDLVPSLPYEATWLTQFRYSAPYYEAVLGFAVRDARRADFATRETLGRLGKLRIGVMIDSPTAQELVRSYLSDNVVDLVTVDTPSGFFRGARPDIDALLVLAEVGTAWTLLHPHYTIVVPQPAPIRLPTGFGIHPGDEDLADFVDAWLLLQKGQGRLQEIYDYWVLGQGAHPHRPRWSVVRDVFGWAR